MSMTTGQLMSELAKAKNIKTFFSEYEAEFHNISSVDFLNDLLVERHLSVAQVAKASGQGDYVYKVFSGQRKAGRDIILCIALGMKLNVDETQLLLRIARLAALDVRDKRDSVVIYSLENHLPVQRANELLCELNQPEL